MLNKIEKNVIMVSKNILYPILKKFDLILLKRKSYDFLKEDFKLLDRLIRIHTNETRYIGIEDFPVEIVITSMDRAIQVHALLSSIYEKFDNEPPIHLYIKANSPEHMQAYKDLSDIFKSKNINWIWQKEKSTFKLQLVEILRSIKSRKMFFLVDDMVFTEDIKVSDFKLIDPRKEILSLRMGRNLDYCYTIGKPQKLPKFIKSPIIDSEFIAWDWERGEYDWNYPISVDGHIFDTEEILAFSENVEYTSPNWYENNLQKYVGYFKNRYGLCYPKSKVFNMPINKVNVDNENTHGEIDVEYLLRKWQEGYQIDYKKFYGVINTDAHQEFPIEFIKRQ